MLSRPDASRRGLLGTMSSGSRRTATILGALTLTVTLLFAGLLYRVGTMPDAARKDLMAPASAISTTESPASENVPIPGATSPEGTEEIADDAVPLAAPVQQAVQPASPRVPVYLFLGFVLGFVVVFFLAHIHRVNTSIEIMRKGGHR